MDDRSHEMFLGIVPLLLLPPNEISKVIQHFILRKQN